MSLINLPIGTIIAWENASVPSGWAICDGTGGTPDLRNRFVLGASVDGDVRVTGGASTHTHTNPNTSTRAAHNHGGSKSVGVDPGSSAWSTIGSGLTVASSDHDHGASVGVTGSDEHAHTIGDTNSANTLPRYIQRSFIRRMS